MFRPLITFPLVLTWALTPLAVFGQVVEEHATEIIHPPTVKDTQQVKPDLSTVAEQIILKTNHFRQAEKQSEVQVSTKLTATAQYFAEYMARTSRYGHRADGNSPAERARKHGYDYCLIAENIAYDYSSRGFQTQELAEGFFEGWKHSPGHRKNMLDPDVTETGVAVARGEDTGFYFAVQLFGRPHAQAIEFRVANEADVTVRYQVGDQTFPLPPHSLRTHQRCRPSDVTFLLPEVQKEKKTTSKTIRPRSGDRFLIRREQGRLRVLKQ